MALYDDVIKWFACEQPERPMDLDGGWHLAGCQPCLLKAKVELQRNPEDPKRKLVLALMDTYEDTGGQA